jgi:hypothetical protein
MLVCVLSLAAQTCLPGQTQQSTTDGTAQLIGASSEIRRLGEISGSTEAADKWQILWLHQRISEKVTAASLRVDATIAQIDNEIAQANELRGLLSDRRDRMVSRANLWGAILGGTVGATSSGLQLSSSLSKPAAGVGIGAGALSSGFALYGIHAQPGKSSLFDFQSNMLAQIFGRSTLPNCQYPTTIWSFLNEPALGSASGLTRREELLQSWVNVRRIDSLESREKIDHLTSQPSQQLKLSIDDLEDRAAMLQDLRARISYLKRDLGTLLSSLPAVGDTE